MKIPFVDLKLQYETLKVDIDNAIREVIEKTAFISGAFAKEFEIEFSNYLNLKHVISCANGTDSLEILLKVMGVGAGDEVIVPAVSWISTSEAVISCGATPVFVDIEGEYYTISAEEIEKNITPKTKVIIPVHLYGNPANMPAIIKIAKEKGVSVLEDCAQAHGASIDGRKIGTWGEAASFSFYPGKNLGAFGDAGAMVTNNDNLAELSRMIANHGQLDKHNHKVNGRNSRMDGIQAAILSVKLKYLDSWNEKRRNAAFLYCDLLQGSTIKLPKISNEFKQVFHVFPIQVKNRDILINRLEERGIQCGVHYPKSLPYIGINKEFISEVDHFENAIKLTENMISLPIFPEITEDQINYICNNILEIVE